MKLRASGVCDCGFRIFERVTIVDGDSALWKRVVVSSVQFFSWCLVTSLVVQAHWLMGVIYGVVGFGFLYVETSKVWLQKGDGGEV